MFEDRYKENMDHGQAELLYSFAVSIFAIGGMLGGFSGGIIANRFGRSVCIILNYIKFFEKKVSKLRVYNTQTTLSIPNKRTISVTRNTYIYTNRNFNIN